MDSGLAGKEESSRKEDNGGQGKDGPGPRCSIPGTTGHSLRAHAEHRNYGAGYVDVPVELHDSLVLSTLESLAGQGFRRIVVWRGCGGHDLRETVKPFNETCEGQSRAFLPGHPYHDVWCRTAIHLSQAVTRTADGIAVQPGLRPST